MEWRMHMAVNDGYLFIKLTEKGEQKVVFKVPTVEIFEFIKTSLKNETEFIQLGQTDQTKKERI